MCPIYEYFCDECQVVTEVIVKMGSEEPVPCEVCKGDTHKITSLCGWDLKGEGWFNPHMPKKRARGGT